MQRSTRWSAGGGVKQVQAAKKKKKFRKKVQKLVASKTAVSAGSKKIFKKRRVSNVKPRGNELNHGQKDLRERKSVSGARRCTEKRKLLKNSCVLGSDPPPQPLAWPRQGSHGHEKSWKTVVMEKSWNMKISQKVHQSWKSHENSFFSWLWQLSSLWLSCMLWDTIITISETMWEWESWKKQISHGKVMEFCFPIFVGTLPRNISEKRTVGMSAVCQMSAWCYMTKLSLYMWFYHGNSSPPPTWTVKSGSGHRSTDGVEWSPLTDIKACLLPFSCCLTQHCSVLILCLGNVANFHFVSNSYLPQVPTPKKKTPAGKPCFGIFWVITNSGVPIGKIHLLARRASCFRKFTCPWLISLANRASKLQDPLAQTNNNYY